MGHLFQEVVRHVEHMSPRECFWVLAAVIIVGAICLRGFGSRSRY
jgi:hypothetical protein